MKKVIPGKTIAPYSPAVVFDKKLVFVSGQIADSGDTPFPEQVKEVLEKLKNVLEQAGASLDTVIKNTVYLTDLNNFAAYNEVYKKYFTKDYPARSTIGINSLPLGVKIEIEAVAYVK